jgi:3D (Asp-Asp-Asp) domain-containing protein
VIRADGSAQVFNYVGRAQQAFTNCAPLYPGLKPTVRAALGRTLFAAVPPDAPYGLGVSNFRLVPYRTVAVDPTQFPYGSLIYVPQLRGRPIRLPDGSTATHDGYLFAGDTGGAIKGNHIDVFTGNTSANFAPAVLTSSPNSPFNAYFVQRPDIAAALRSLHQRN